MASISGLLACGGSGGTADSTNPTQVPNNASGSTIASGIDVTNIHQLMVAPPDISSSVLASIGKSINSLLYAIAGIRDAFAQTSQVSKVYALDANGNIQSLKISELVSRQSLAASSNWVIDTPQYAIMNFDSLFRPTSDGKSSKQCVLLGVRKSDGKFACISTNPRCGPGSICDPNKYLSQLKTNSTGDVLYIVLGDGGLAKVDIKDPANVIETTLFTQSLGGANYPVANRSSDVFTSINILNSSDIATKIFGSDGALLYTVPDPLITCAFAGGAGNEDNFFYIAGNHLTGHTLYKLTKNANNTFSRAEILTQNSNYDGLALNSTGCTAVAMNGERVFAISADPSFLNNPNLSGNVLFEILNPAIAPTQYTLSSRFNYATDLRSYKDGLAVLGLNTTTDTHGIQRIDLTTSPPTITTVLETGTYKITSMSVSSTGDISMLGVRKSDGLNVVSTFAKRNIDATQKSLNNKPNSIASIK